MGNRSRFVAASALISAGVLTRKRRARLRAAAEGMGEAIQPSVVAGTRQALDVNDGVGEGHAPGHVHLPRPPSRWRPGRGVVHLPKGDRPRARD